jgi:hypothetical protein
MNHRAEATGTKHEHQLALENLYDQNQLLPRMRRAFKECVAVNFRVMMADAEISEAFGFDLLAQIALHKRATVATMVGCLRHHFDSAQETARVLERAVNAGLLSYFDREQKLIVIYEISERLQRELDLFQYPLPMIVEPRHLQTNLDSGYLTGRGSVLLRDNHHEDDVCLDHLNRMNQMKLSINLDVAETIHNKWKGLDKKAANETWDEFKKRKKTFEKYCSTAKDVIATVMQAGNELHMTHKYDKRGRTYCMGYHITYQGTDWNKAILELPEKEELTS